MTKEQIIAGLKNAAKPYEEYYIEDDLIDAINQYPETSRQSLRQSVKKDSPSPQIQTRQMTVKLLTVNFSDNLNT